MRNHRRQKRSEDISWSEKAKANLFEAIRVIKMPKTGAMFRTNSTHDNVPIYIKEAHVRTQPPRNIDITFRTFLTILWVSLLGYNITIE